MSFNKKFIIQLEHNGQLGVKTQNIIVHQNDRDWFGRANISIITENLGLYESQLGTKKLDNTVFVRKKLD